MKLEDQVCSLELAKKLAELGVKQESIFYYLQMYDGSSHILFHRELTGSKDRYIAAFTVAELGEMLPCGQWEMKTALDGTFIINFEDKNATDKNEADARAKMIIYLIENHLMEVTK